MEVGRGTVEERQQAAADRSMRLLRSERAADRRRAVAALAQMHGERAGRLLFEAAADADAKVATLAVRALVEMGEAARSMVAEAWQGTERRLWHATVNYLSVQIDEPLCQEVPWDKMIGQPMVWVPPGSFLMGSDGERDLRAHASELPQHRVTLPGYWIGRYPVTVAQFQAFVRESGYRPGDSDCLAGPGDYPVRYVVWREALAFCRWLSGKAGLPVTLPSEAEWEKAARGTDGRVYPWGDDPPDENRCNHGGTVGKFTPVGRYSPRGDSPYGCADMAGNVWEWTRSLYRDYPYDPGDGREDLAVDDRRIVRGGAFLEGVRYIRSAYRYWLAPNFRRYSVGFRLVIAPGFASDPLGKDPRRTRRARRV